MNPIAKPEERNWRALSLSDEMDGILERVSAIMGVPKASGAMQAMCEGLPAIIDRADDLQKSINQIATRIGQKSNQPKR